MKRRIEKAVVLGAGTMGARIAAHFANAGLPVVLLDIVPPGAAPGSPEPQKNPSPPHFSPRRWPKK
jgi:3-hydroxyacyl-CoA dehydrogenase